MAKILATGIATLDIINTVDGFPAEDSEVRALAQQTCRGGNATNTLTVLSQLGHQCFWAGTLADEPDANIIKAALDEYSIDYRYCEMAAYGKVPTSYITLNQKNGSRTIVHYRDLQELSFDAFAKIPVETFDWLHFEGRNVSETAKMLEHARAHCVDQPFSLEVEKHRENIESLFPYADLIMFSRAYARNCGFEDGEAFLRQQAKSTPDAILVCAWGEHGAYALNADGQFFYSPAYPPAEIIDTLGAGDTFNAGLIDALVSGNPLEKALESACRLAGKKCAIRGFHIH